MTYTFGTKRQMSVKERIQPCNPNFRRFYEFDASTSDICRDCPAKLGNGEWEALPKRSLGAPVHTNWPELRPIMSAQKIYICESPSDKETSHDLPTVGATGQGIFKRAYGNLTTGWLDKLDAEIYRTNIVRCQTDAGLQKRADATRKNRRVRSAFSFCVNHLQEELTKIVLQYSSGNAAQLNIVIAVGSHFPILIREVCNRIQNIQIQCEYSVNLEITNHPSEAQANDDIGP
jgi:hypothetical protein